MIYFIRALISLCLSFSSHVPGCQCQQLLLSDPAVWLAEQRRQTAHRALGTLHPNWREERSSSSTWAGTQQHRPAASRDLSSHRSWERCRLCSCAQTDPMSATQPKEICFSSTLHPTSPQNSPQWREEQRPQLTTVEVLTHSLDKVCLKHYMMIHIQVLNCPRDGKNRTFLLCHHFSTTQLPL